MTRPSFPHATALLVAILSLISPLTGMAEDVSFGCQKTIADDLSTAYGVSVADLDGDGDQDVLATNDVGNRVVWFESNGRRSFSTAKTITQTEGKAIAALPADLDNDGDLDLVTVSSRLSWQEYGPCGFSEERVITAAYSGPFDPHVVDIDADGDLDIAICFIGSNRISWFESTSSGFEERVLYQADVLSTPYGLCTGDIDGDSDIDVAAVLMDENRLIWLENLGNGTFNPTEHQVGLTGERHRLIDCGDLDGDGDLDILSKAYGQLSWWENTGAGAFSASAHVIDTATFYRFVVLAADLDQDGDPDVVSANQTSEPLTWYENLGGASFGPAIVIEQNEPTGLIPALTAIDLDSDDDIDLLSTFYSAGKVAWYENVGCRP